ncbi:D-2-hydroxyacid dehydrogenase family protein [Kushneria marisflavi]|uniref:Hydroxyacid dehydrogenase n=1 Tax=Kushneria marisflavi TaxID=157779 RepID=A0A240UQM3_9GAMM|nr:D-2-hydroxyacid dehydrogenase family protein [Kushneria marisflavi]ART63329.1 hydroxyacid dehydrogenase [Kushneria marisflavi]RKD84368.1 phosphoglycerate dehydrogenase-like enzyme [Kushneria marisflavi]
MRCAIIDDYQNAALAMADWSRLEGRITITPFHDHLDDENALVERLVGFEVIVIMRERTPFPASLLSRLPQLKLLITSGMRNAAIDLEAAREQGIAVCGTDSHPAPPTELAWALILGLARHLPAEHYHFTTNGPWQSTVGTTLAGRTLGIVGLGKIGTRMARIAQAFDMEVMAWSEHLTPARCEAAGVTHADSLKTLMGASDVVSIHLVLSARTRHLIDREALEWLSPSSLLINTSRADIVDQIALLDVLSEHRIAGAGLDVFEQEPLPFDHPLRRLPNVLATPHLGYVSDTNYRTWFGQAIENIEAWLSGTPIRRL